MLEFDENKIVNRLRAGDLSALDIMMNRYKQELFMLAFRVLGSKEDAEEILQDVFLKAFKSIGGFERKSKLSTWLYRICINLSINRKKQLQRQASKRSVQTPETDTLVSSENIEEKYSQNETHARVLKLLDQLKPDENAAVSLYYLKGYSCGEISEMLSKPVNSVKTDLHRARKRLKSLLTAFSMYWSI